MGHAVYTHMGVQKTKTGANTERVEQIFFFLQKDNFP